MVSSGGGMGGGRAQAHLRQSVSFRKMQLLEPSKDAEILIKRFSGMDFTSLLCFYRLKQAERFLCHSHKSVDEISEQCGFSYTSYFITRFKKRYGVTPHVFRNQVTTKT